MSGVVDVGDALELTFNTAPGAEVEVTWFDPDLVPVLDAVEVTETPSGSGQFPYTFLPDRAGIWTARFRSSGAAVSVEEYWIRARALTGPLPLAVIGDVVEQFGALTVAQEGLTKALLRAASSMVRAQYPTIDASITAGTVNGDVVALAVTNMVLRVLRNPRGLRSETTGPFSRTYDTSAAAGLLVITAEEARMLTPVVVVPSAIGAIGSITMRPALLPPPQSSYDRW